ncbi:MAG: hypothetical protein HRU23_18810 [Gammaproteobacteria bacterium]|nr:hypothetical protein [Gammaproteobacteria bacterium]
MNIFEPRKLYNNLSQEQQQFIKDKGCCDSMSAHKWIRFLEPICRYDQLCDTIAHTVGKWLAFSLVALIISVFIGVMFETILIPAIALVPLVILGLIYRSVQKKDVNDNLRKTVYPLINVLSLEIGNRQKITLKLNFDKELVKQAIVKLPQSKPKTIFYSFNIIEASTVFKDGTKFTWKVNDVIRKRTRQNPRGKTKTKYKLKRKSLINLNFDTKVYQLSKANLKLKKELGKLTQSADKICYKQTIKQSYDGTTGELNTKEMLSTMRVPYQHLTQGAAT